MSESPSTQPSGARQVYGDFAPALAGYTDDLLFGQVWQRPDLSPKERSLITLTAVLILGNSEQLSYQLRLAKQNGNTEEELIGAITHLAFYAGWPRAMAALSVAKEVFANSAT